MNYETLYRHQFLPKERDEASLFFSKNSCIGFTSVEKAKAQ
ncbi:hypothetical protein N824_22175 [Pedobacter sp. V48]|nr:hypothetical protein N824_22175 [Pedobacter sp. V48]